MKNPIKRVLIINGNYPDYQIERKILSGFSVELTEINDTSLIGYDSLLEEADAVLVREFPLTRDTILQLKNCKIIVRYGVGVDNIDLKAAKEQKIYVANVPDYGTEVVSDHALALLLSVSRRIVTRDRDVRKGIWNVGAKESIYSFRGKTLGIIGFGRIGRAFRRKAMPLGFTRVLVFDPWYQGIEEGIECANLEELCSHSDVISLHAPLTNENYHIINKETLALMKENTILINTSRGGLIDEQALEESLSQQKIFGAGIDVFEQEPPTIHRKLFKLDNVVVTDHMGWYSEESIQTLKEKAAKEIARVFSGETPSSWVNRWEV